MRTIVNTRTQYTTGRRLPIGKKSASVPASNQLAGQLPVTARETELSSQRVQGDRQRLTLSKLPVAAVVWLLLACCWLRPLPAEQAAPSSEPHAFPLRQVYVPIEELDAVFDRDKKGVILSRDEFAKLFELARRRAADHPTPPVGIVLHNATYQARISGEQLLVSAVVEFTQFSDDWQTLELPINGLAVESALLNGQPARVGRSGKNFDVLHLFSDQATAGKLELELSAQLVRVGSDRTVSFGLLGSPQGTLEVNVAADRHLVVDGRLIQRPAPADEEAAYNVAVGGKKKIRLLITDRPTPQSADALTLASTNYALLASPGEVTWHATTSLDIYGEAIDRLRFSVPSALAVAAVKSTGLGSWKLIDAADDADRKTIELVYQQPFSGSRTIDFRGLLTTAAVERWRVPNLLLEGGTAHTGRVLVKQVAGVRLLPERAEGVRRVGLRIPDAGAAENAATASALAFDVWREDFALEFLTLPLERQLLVDLLTILDVTRQGVDIDAVAKMETLYVPLFEIDVSLPAEWDIKSAIVNDRPAPWRTLPEQAGVHLVRITLESPLTPGNSLRLQLSAHRDLENWPAGREGVDFDMPEVRLPHAGVVEGAYVIKAENRYELVPSDVTGLDPANLKIPGERLGYQYQDTRFSGRLRVAPKPARVAATTSAFTRLDPQALRSHIRLSLDVEGGGIEQLDVSLPESVTQELRFAMREGAGRIVEQRPGAAAEGRRLWKLRFDRELVGRFVLSVDVESPRGEAAEFAVHQLQVPVASRQNGYLAVEAGAQQQLTIKTAGADGLPLSEVDPIDLPPVDYRPQERIVAAYRYITPDFTAVLSEQRFDPLAMPAAICRQSDLASVLGRTGEFHHQAKFQFVAVGVQSLRVVLPASAALWAALIDGEPVEVRRMDESLLVPVPPVEDPVALRTLTLFFATEHDPLDTFGEISQLAPVLSVVGGDGSVQPLQMLAQNWVLHHPRETMLVKSSGRFRALGELDRAGFLSRLEQRLAVASPRALAWQALYVVVAAGIVLLIAGGYRRYGGLGLLVSFGILALVGIALVLPSMLTGRMNAEYFTSRGRSSAPATEALFDETDVGGRERADMPQGGRGGGGFGGGGGGDFGSGEGATREAIVEDESESMPGFAEGELATEDGDMDGVLSNRARGIRARLRASYEGSQGGERNPSDAPVAAPAETSQPTIQRFNRELPLGIGRQAGARLSVVLGFERPETYTAKHFQYLGTDSGSDSAAVAVVYEDRRAGMIFRTFIASAVLLLFWILRRRSAITRAVLTSAGVAVTLALTAIVPTSWHVLLDGIFIGSLAGLLLWTVHGLSMVWSARSDLRRSPVGRGGLTATLFVTLLLLGEVVLFAAEEKQPARDRPEVTSVESAQPTVIVPYDPAEDPLAAKHVYLPHDEFIKLWNEAYPDQRLKSPAPVNYLVAGALYDARLNEADAGGTPHVAVTSRIVIFTFRAQQVTVPLPFGPVAVRQATLNGQPAAIVSKGSGGKSSLAVVVDQPGRHLLDIQFELPAELRGPAGEFTLPLRPVVSGKLRFRLPGEELTLTVKGSSGSYRRQTDAAEPTVEFPIDRGGDVTVRWFPSQVRGTADAVVHAVSTNALVISDAGIQLNSSVSFQVRQGTYLEAEFAMPPELSVRQIRGADVRGWEIQDDQDARILRVYLGRNVQDSTQIEFELYLTRRIDQSSESISVPGFAPLNVIRETGTLGIFAGEQFSLRAVEDAGISQIDVKQFPTAETLRIRYAAPRLAYRFSRRPFTLELAVSRRQPELDVVAEYGAKIGLRKVRLASRFKLKLREAPRSRLEFGLPEGFLPLDVDATHLSDWYLHRTRDGERNLMIDLDASYLGSIEVTIEGVVPKGPDDDSVELGFPGTLEPNRKRSSLAVWVDESYSAAIDEPGDWKSVGPEQLGPELKSIESRPARFAFVSDETETSFVAFELSRAEPRLSADVVTVATVTETSINYTFAMNWMISQAAADTFVLTTPAWLSGRLDFTGADIRQVSTKELDDDRVRWIITLRAPQRRRYFMTATAMLPPPAENELRLPVPVFEDQRPREGENVYEPLETQRHYVVLVNQSQGQLTALNPNQLASIQPDELPITVRKSLIDQAAQLARFRRQGPAPSWRIERFAQQRGARASVNIADVVTVVERDGTLRGQALYRVKNRSRQYLALRMPEQADVLSVFVDGRPSRPVVTERGGEAIHLVALPKSSEADLPFEVKLVYSTTLAGGALSDGIRLAAEEIALPVPHVLTVQEDAELGIPVLRTRWSVYLPHDFDATTVADPGRTNLSVSSEAGLALLDEAARLSTAGDLLSVLEGANTARQKYRALDNLKNITQGLRLYDSSQSMTAEARDVRERKAEVLERLQRQQEQLQLDDVNQNAVVIDGKASNVLLGDREQQEQLREQARNVYTDNDFTSPATEGEERTGQSSSFGFRWKESAAEPESSVKGFAPHQQAQRAQQRLRNLRRRGSQVEDLNQALIEQKNRDMQTPLQRSLGVDAAGKINIPARISGKSPLPEDKDLADRREADELSFEYEAGQQLAGTPIQSEAARKTAEAAVPGAWTTAGGLSLAIDIPKSGQKLTFSKIGGAPKLALAIRPRQTLRSAGSLLWAIVWLSVGIATVVTASRAGVRDGLRRYLPRGLIAVGLVLYFLLPSPGTWWGFALFLLGTIAVATQRRKLR